MKKFAKVLILGLSVAMMIATLICAICLSLNAIRPISELYTHEVAWQFQWRLSIGFEYETVFFSIIAVIPVIATKCLRGRILFWIASIIAIYFLVALTVLVVLMQGIFNAMGI